MWLYSILLFLGVDYSQRKKNLSALERQAARRTLAYVLSVRSSLYAEEEFTDKRIDEMEHLLGIMRNRKMMIKTRADEAEEQIGIVRHALDRQEITEVSLSENEEEEENAHHSLPPPSDACTYSSSSSSSSASGTGSNADDLDSAENLDDGADTASDSEVDTGVLAPSSARSDHAAVKSSPSTKDHHEKYIGGTEGEGEEGYSLQSLKGKRVAT